MLKALLVVWSLDPSGAGAVSIQPLPSMEACQVAMTQGQRMCVPSAQVSGLMRTLTAQGCSPASSDGRLYVCRAKVTP